MGEIRFVGTGESRGYPCLGRKKKKSVQEKLADILIRYARKDLSVQEKHTDIILIRCSRIIVLVSLFFEFEREVVGWCDDAG